MEVTNNRKRGTQVLLGGDLHSCDCGEQASQQHPCKISKTLTSCYMSVETQNMKDRLCAYVACSIRNPPLFV
jgi:hypothetical protein